MNFLAETSHRRFNALTGDWVLVSPHRTERPWQGQIDRAPAPAVATYDPACYLCPGNARAGGHQNPPYKSTFAFDNDFAALRPDAAGSLNEDGLLIAEAEPGACRVICFSPDHSLTLARMPVEAIRDVVDVWASESVALEQRGFSAVQIFENRGEMMGASNAHPHCQIWASATVPELIRREDERQRGRPLLADYLRAERDAQERIVFDGEHWTALVPFWAVWPFETMLLPARHVGAIAQLSGDERTSLAAALGRLTSLYDRLFDAPFPYTMGFHQRPRGSDHFALHAHFYPPLLRSATVRKFMVGYELLAEPQRDITAERAADRLRQVDR